MYPRRFDERGPSSKSPIQHSPNSPLRNVNHQRKGIDNSPRLSDYNKTTSLLINKSPPLTARTPERRSATKNNQQSGLANSSNAGKLTAGIFKQVCCPNCRFLFKVIRDDSNVAVKIPTNLQTLGTKVKKNQESQTIESLIRAVKQLQRPILTEELSSIKTPKLKIDIPSFQEGSRLLSRIHEHNNYNNPYNPYKQRFVSSDIFAMASPPQKQGQFSRSPATKSPKYYKAPQFPLVFDNRYESSKKSCLNLANKVASLGEIVQQLQKPPLNTIELPSYIKGLILEFQTG